MTKDHIIEFEADVETIISPLEVQAGLQRIVKRLCVPESWAESPHSPRVWIRIRHLIEEYWLLGSDISRERDGGRFILAPENPPISIDSDLARSSTEIASRIELSVDQKGSWSKEVLLLPPCAIPTNFDHALALAALIDPADPAIIEFLGQALKGVDGVDPRKGLTPLGPLDAANHVYQALSRWPTLTDARDAGLIRRRQIVRSPEQVLHRGDASCIDIAVLFAAACERIRLSTIILGLKSDENVWHAIPGVRLAEFTSGKAPLVQELSEIKEICGAAEIRLFDPTAIIACKSAGAADALARSRLLQAEHAFLIDIPAARDAGISSLTTNTRLPDRRQSLRSDANPRREGRRSARAGTKHLQQELLAGNVVVLLGNALDASGAGSRQDLARLLSSLLSWDGDEQDLLAMGSEIQKERGRSVLENVALRVFRRRRDPSLYRVLASLPISTVVSFIPDVAAEQAFTRANPPFRRLTDNYDLGALRSKDAGRELYLLAGSAIEGTGLMLTYSDKEAARSRIAMLGRGLRDRLAESTLLLIGCDCSDPDLLDLIEATTQHIRTGVRQIYTCGSHPEDHLFSSFPLEFPVSDLIRKLENWAMTGREGAEPIELVSRFSPISGRHPYRSLDAFNIEDRDLFFGRDQDISNVFQEILASPSRLAILCGRSGVGKTSLVKAGLFPAFSDSSNYCPSYCRLGRDPHAALIGALISANSPTLPKQDLRSGSIGDIAALLNELGAPEQVVFVDQVEECFFSSAKPRFGAFLADVLAAISSPDSLLRMVLIIREDYLARLLSYGESGDGELGTIVRLKELSREGAREAIINPAVACGLDVDADLVSAILDDLSPDTILPAHLQIICERVYRERGANRRLNLDLYQRVGRARKVLDNHLAAQFERLPVAHRSAAEDILRCLITSERTRAVRTLEEIAIETNLDCGVAEPIVNELIHTSRLVSVSTGQTRTYELIHELLAEAVAVRCERIDMRVRQVQEMLDQEVSLAQHQELFTFPADKLRLVDQHRDELKFTSEAVLVVCQAFESKGAVPDFWSAKLRGMDLKYRWLFALGHVPSSYDMAILSSIVKLSKDRMSLLPEGPFSLELVEAILQSAASGEGGIFTGWIGLLGQRDTSRELLRRIFRDFKELKEATRSDVLYWITTIEEWRDEDLEFVANLDASQEDLAVVCGTFSRNGPLSNTQLTLLARLEPDRRLQLLMQSDDLEYGEGVYQRLLDIDRGALALLPPGPLSRGLVSRLMDYIDLGAGGNSEWAERVHCLIELDTSRRLARSLIYAGEELSSSARAVVLQWLHSTPNFGGLSGVTRCKAAGIVILSEPVPPHWEAYIAGLSHSEKLYLTLGQWVNSLDEVVFSDILKRSEFALSYLPCFEFSFELAYSVGLFIVETTPDKLGRAVILMLKDRSGRAFLEMARRIHVVPRFRQRMILDSLLTSLRSRSGWEAPLWRLLPGIRLLYDHKPTRQKVQDLLLMFPDHERAHIAVGTRSLGHLLTHDFKDADIDFAVFLRPIFSDPDDVEAARLAVLQGYQSRALRRMMRLIVAGPSPLVLAAVLRSLGEVADVIAADVLEALEHAGERGNYALVTALTSTHSLSARACRRLIDGLWPRAVVALIALTGRTGDLDLEHDLIEKIRAFLLQYTSLKSVVEQFRVETPRLERERYGLLHILRKLMEDVLSSEGEPA